LTKITCYFIKASFTFNVALNYILALYEKLIIKSLAPILVPRRLTSYLL
jgi:hypothetical protein